jgi:prepilin-type N-terminal cleavage/methylation domain-containing protein
MKPFKHNPLSLNKKIHESGFTLIELAVVIVIVGIIISIMATVLPSLIQSAKIKKTQAILEKMDYSLEGYIVANGRCPCPDTDGDGIENRIPGASPPTDDTCSSYVGDIPFVTLGLSSGNDAWGNRLKYGVYEDFIRTTKSGLCASLSSFIVASFDNSKLYTTDQSGNNTHQAYVIASGGPKDLDNDGSDVFFDGLNEGADVQFDDPNRIEDHVTYLYDDLMRATSFTYLYGKNCTGGAGGGTGGGGAEICDNGVDDDGDGYVDCDDQDCYGHPSCGVTPSGCDNFQIVQSGLPGDTLMSDYSATLQATGGVTPYEWSLDNNGGFGDFFLNTYTGKLTGTLNQCPGTYSITVSVDDSTLSGDGGPCHKSKSFDIQVTANLEISRTSGSGTNITWDSPTQQETFKTNSEHLGDINWNLDSGGATGFIVVSTGSDTCVIKKNGSTGAGAYTFTLTATDSGCASNTAEIILTVTVTASGAPAPYTADLVAKWRLDECSWNGTAGEIKDSGNDILDGTAQNGANTIGSGKVCRAGKFDGSNDYVSVPDDPKLQLSAPLTLALWVKVNANASDWVRLAGKGNSTYRNYGLWLRNDGAILFQIYSAGGNGDAMTTITVNDGKWHHVVGVYDGSTMKVYIDKIERASISYSRIPYTSSDPFTIGYAGFHTYMNGYIDEVALFSRALLEDDIISMYNDTSRLCSSTCYTNPIAEYRMENYPWTGADNEVRDSGSGGNHGKEAYTGSGSLPTQTSTSDGKVCRAGVFTRIDANNGGYLDLGDPTDGDLDPDTDPWTISAWIKWDGSTGENIIYNKENLYEARVSGGYVNYAWLPHWAWDGGTSFPVTADTWTYVTTVYDGTRQTLYKDGVQVYSRSQTGAIGSNSSKFLIAARGSGSPSNFFGGMIDEVRIYNRALSDSEIRADMTATRTCE